jgi:predicted CXXCH cytochrome family protein
MAGTSPGTGIKQTSHDLSSGGVGASYVGAGTADSLDRVCIYCHAPHHSTLTGSANNAISYFPLWNHAVTNTASWQTYTNGSDAPNSLQQQANSLDSITNPGSVSILCLSCHDGSVAVSAYGFAPSQTIGNAGGTTVAGTKYQIGAGGDLKNHHPIGFDYADVAAKDDEINPVDSDLLGANTYGLTISDLLWNNRMECSSCHDVHNTKNEGNKFTWVMDTQSNLCLTCHAK